MKLGPPKTQAEAFIGVAAKIRVQLEVEPSRIREIDALQKNTRCRTRKELYEAALALLEWAVQEREKGHVIVSVDANGKVMKEVVMPQLMHLKSE